LTQEDAASRSMGQTSDPVAILSRWQASGAVWRVLGRTGDTISIGLFTCNGGEEVDRLASNDPQLLQFVADRHHQD
jgi:hypothetical protein